MNGLIKNAPSWIDLSKKENIRSVKNQVEQNIKNQSQKLIQQFQQKKIDPLGIRDQIRSRSRKWTIQQIQAMYPSIDINVEADVNVVQSGIGE